MDQAIAIARQAGIELKIAAKIDRVDQAYFDAVIKPLLKGPGVEFVGEIGHSEKERIPGRSHGPADSGSVAGTVRVGHDRSHGMWHSCDRLIRAAQFQNWLKTA